MRSDVGALKMILSFKDFLRHDWPLEDQLIGRKTKDADQPVPRGRDWRLFPGILTCASWLDGGLREKLGPLLTHEEYSQSLPKTLLCTASFSLVSHPVRFSIYEELRSKPFIEFGEIYRKWYPVKEHHHNQSFLRQLKSSTFCISPRGHGVDCFRTWDALYEKCIPIVSPSNCEVMSRYAGLPILFVDSYAEITERFLRDEYERISSTSYDFSQLSLSYWLRRFGAERLTAYLTLQNDGEPS